MLEIVRKSAEVVASAAGIAAAAHGVAPVSSMTMLSCVSGQIRGACGGAGTLLKGSRVKQLAWAVKGRWTSRGVGGGKRHTL